MKIANDSFEVVRERQREWHRVFLWWPLRIGHSDVRWLEFVERRLVKDESYFETWAYRPIGATDEGFERRVCTYF